MLYWYWSSSRSDTREETAKWARKPSWSMDLYFLFEIALSQTDCFCKNISTLKGKWSNSIEEQSNYLSNYNLKLRWHLLMCNYVRKVDFAHAVRNWQIKECQPTVWYPHSSGNRNVYWNHFRSPDGQFWWQENQQIPNIPLRNLKLLDNFWVGWNG